MNLKEYYLTCINKNLFTKREWIISVFSVVKNRPFVADATYAYQLLYDPSNPDIIFYANPTDTGFVAEPLAGSKANVAPYLAYDELDIVDGDIPMSTGAINTTYGIILGNMNLLYYPFGNKFKFINDEIPESITDRFAELLTDNVKPGEAEKDDRIYVRELIRFGEGCDMLSALDKLFTFSGSNKLLTVDKSVLELRDKLIDENRENLSDPRVQAMIEDQLVKADKASFKGDPAEKFLVSGKSFNPTRKKQLIMIGGSAGFGGAAGGTSSFIPQSLRDGWKIEDIPIHANEARAGSFFRGKETAAGGTDVILATRMGMNTRITKHFCGAKTGLKTTIDIKDSLMYLGQSVVSPDGNPILLTKENINGYNGKTVLLHSPTYCTIEGDAYCEVCIGKVWSLLKNGLNNAISNTGDVFMYDKMKRMHGKALKLARFYFMNVIR